MPELATAPGLVQTLIKNYVWSGLQAVLIGIVVIVLALGVVRPLLSSKSGDAAAAASPSPAEVEPAGADTAPDPFAYLSDYTRERPDETVALLQSWLAEDRKAAVNE